MKTSFTIQSTLLVSFILISNISIAQKNSPLELGSIIPMSEELMINQEVVNIVNTTKQNKRKVCAVGTTVMRGLESSVSSTGTLNTYIGWTHKFIFPPYDFSIANALITNFHMPKSTLLMMVSAFAGYDFMMKAYNEAVKEKYRFYSYGDAMLIL